MCVCMCVYTYVCVYVCVRMCVCGCVCECVCFMHWQLHNNIFIIITSRHYYVSKFILSKHDLSGYLTGTRTEMFKIRVLYTNTSIHHSIPLGTNAIKTVQSVKLHKDASPHCGCVVLST